ncbi:MAG: helix-turn-helix domain-containing protein [Pseudomonadota bacterium]
MADIPQDQFVDQLMDRLAARLTEFVPTTKNLLTSDQLASRLSLSQKTIRRYRALGMPCVPVGRCFRYDLAQVLVWLRGRAA